LGETSEKGSTRKDTGNWVTRYGFLFLEEFDGLRCFTKRIWLGELRFSGFWDFVRRSTWGLERRGDQLGVSFAYLEEFKPQKALLR
jgi:hypothetical protein